jgi:hypothetical protein
VVQAVQVAVEQEEMFHREMERLALLILVAVVGAVAVVEEVQVIAQVVLAVQAL